MDNNIIDEGAEARLEAEARSGAEAHFENGVRLEAEACFIAGEIDEKDAGYLLSMIENDSAAAGRLFELKDIYQAAALRGKEKPARTVRPLVRLAGYAAALLVGACLAGSVFMAVNRVDEEAVCEVRTGKNERAEVTFPDGSKATLNSHSSIRYAGQFGRKGREVQLRGAAFFEVVANPDFPFRVATPRLSVTATGTTFLVDDSDGEAMADVALVEGEVSVATAGNDGEERPLAVLKPDDHLVFDTVNSTAGVTSENLYKYYAWVDNKLVFRGDPFPEVVERISRRYDVDIELKGAELLNYRYRATFEDESLDEILRLLRLSAPIEYKRVQRTQLPDGSFSAVKIVIEPRK